jgi:XTP/dITP diphosphohydrolase
MEDKRLTALARLLQVMDDLREKCPWDREQTFLSLRNNTIEECFELVDALTEENMAHIREELGDLLLHVVFYSKLGTEANAFDFADVANGVCDKLIYRHPHVYGDVDAENSEIVKANWEELKKREKDKKKRRGVLAGVPKSMPAMVKAYRVGEKASAAGFDWEKKEDVWAKVKEEIAEFEAEVSKGDTRNMEREMGDLFFALINASRLYGIDPEEALALTNNKFISRFNYMESKIEEQGRSLKEATLEEMDAYWDEAKAQEPTEE